MAEFGMCARSRRQKKGAAVHWNLYLRSSSAPCDIFVTELQVVVVATCYYLYSTARNRWIKDKGVGAWRCCFPFLCLCLCLFSPTYFFSFLCIFYVFGFFFKGQMCDFRSPPPPSKLTQVPHLQNHSLHTPRVHFLPTSTDDDGGL